NVVFYAILGILGVWVAFLLSGVHATIAAVLAAFTIPSDVRIKENTYVKKVQDYLAQFKAVDPNDKIPTLTNEQLHILENIQEATHQAMIPIQRLKNAMHPMVTFLILPIFSIANAGVSLAIDPEHLFSTHVALGVTLGLLVGKVVGKFGFTTLAVRLKIAPMPSGMTGRNLLGRSEERRVGKVY